MVIRICFEFRIQDFEINKLDDREYRLALAEARDKLLGAQVEFGLLMQDKNRRPEIGDREDLAGKMENWKWREVELEQKRKRWQEAQFKY